MGWPREISHAVAEDSTLTFLMLLRVVEPNRFRPQGRLKKMSFRLRSLNRSG